MDSSNFDKITAAITGSKSYEDVVYDVCHTPKVTSLTEFLKMYEAEEKFIDEKYDGEPKVAPTIELFAEVFKKLDDFPANLQKLKKHAPIRERLNSNISKSSPTLNDSSSYVGNKENSASLLNLNKFDDVPTASETLKTFIKFQKELKQLNAEISRQDVEEEYIAKLKQLAAFSQQLEKLLPTERVGRSALTEKEEVILEDVVNRMDDLNFIRNHNDISRQQNHSLNNTTRKLEDLVDILSHCLITLNTFQIN